MVHSLATEKVHNIRGPKVGHARGHLLLTKKKNIFVPMSSLLLGPCLLCHYNHCEGSSGSLNVPQGEASRGAKLIFNTAIPLPMIIERMHMRQFDSITLHLVNLTQWNIIYQQHFEVSKDAVFFDIFLLTTCHIFADKKKHTLLTLE